MNSAFRNSAAAALGAARPLAARLDASRDPEDLAADLIEIWSAIETALRALLGGSALSGAALVQQARQKDHLTLGVTHDLLSFAVLRDRVAGGGGQAAAAELAVAANAFFALDSSLAGEPTFVGPEAPAASADTGVPRPEADQPLAAQRVTPRRGQRLAVMTAAAILLLLVAGVATYLLLRGRSPEGLEEGKRLYAARQLSAARMAFERAAGDRPRLALPHIYLGRIAREVGDFPTAQRELTLAARLEPDNALAMRELASYLYVTGEFELARRFYVRAVDLNRDDKLAMGYLACSLARLGRMDDAVRMMQHAGPGEWSACLQARATG